MVAETSEQALFKAACEGDETAYEALQRRLEPVIRRFVRRISGGHDAEDDIVQDTFIRFYRNMHRIQPPSHLRPYLYRIARNRCYDELRREQKQDWLSLDDEPVELYVSFNQGNRNQMDDIAHWILLHMEVREAIDRLSPPQREALILFSEEGLSYSEIAEVQGVSLGTVKSRLFHAKRQLRQLLHPATLEALEDAFSS